jgi:hypothetical protein
MKRLLAVALLAGLTGLGCYNARQVEKNDKADKVRDMILGRWEGVEEPVGLEFTPSGSIIIVTSERRAGTYQFVDESTIEIESDRETIRVTNVKVTRDELSLTGPGPRQETIKLKRVKDFSAKVRSGGPTTRRVVRGTAPARFVTVREGPPATRVILPRATGK